MKILTSASGEKLYLNSINLFEIKESKYIC